MTQLTEVVHFRGEEIPLYVTFGGVGTDPRVSITYVDYTGAVVQILAPTAMSKISPERCFYVWEIPSNAPLTKYVVTYTATVNGVAGFATEPLLVGNPNITYNRGTLRYGPHSSVQEPRDTACYGRNRCITLPKGEF